MQGKFQGISGGTIPVRILNPLFFMLRVLTLLAVGFLGYQIGKSQKGIDITSRYVVKRTTSVGQGIGTLEFLKITNGVISFVSDEAEATELSGTAAQNIVNFLREMGVSGSIIIEKINLPVAV